MINEINQKITDDGKNGTFLQVSSDPIKVNTVYNNEVFIIHLTTLLSAYKMQASLAENKCTGARARLPSYLFNHYACLKIMQLIVQHEAYTHVLVAKMSWANYFPTGAEAQKWDQLLYSPLPPNFARSFDVLPEDYQPKFIIDAGSSKTKFEINLAAEHKDTLEKLEFKPFQMLEDEDFKKISQKKIELVKDAPIPLIATAGVRDLLSQQNDTKKLQDIAEKLKSIDIICFIASGQLEAALEHNACKEILKSNFRTTASMPMHSLSMGGQSTQFSTGKDFLSYDNMGAIAIRRMCCECEACSESTCTKLDEEIGKIVRLFLQT